MYYPNGQYVLWPHMSGLQPDYSTSHCSPHFSSPPGPNPFYSPLQPFSRTEYPVDHFALSTSIPSCRIETDDEIQDSVYVDTFAYLPGPNPFYPPHLQHTAVHHFEYQIRKQEVEVGEIEEKKTEVEIEEIDSKIWCDGEQKEDQEEGEVSEASDSETEDSSLLQPVIQPPTTPTRSQSFNGRPRSLKKLLLSLPTAASSPSTSRPSSSRPSLPLPPAKRFKSLGAPETAKPSRYSLRSTRVRFLREAGVKPMKKSVLNEEAFGRKRF